MIPCAVTFTLKEHQMSIKTPAFKIERTRPLAAILRPTNIDDIIGQQHLVGPGAPLRLMVEKRAVKSHILWGPAGTGKTSIARAVSSTAEATFIQLNATEAKTDDLRKSIKAAQSDLMTGKRTVMFVDEIHRFDKKIQDILLPAVEDGVVVLIGATTEKPKFAVNSTIMSRVMEFECEPLKAQDMVALVKKVKDYYSKKGVQFKFENNAGTMLINQCSGDARKLITAMETIVEVLITDGVIAPEHIQVAIPNKHIVFDKSGNEHFDLAHAMQQSIQNSDANAAIYWLAKWIQSGEDPAYICRRLLVSAFEDAPSNLNALMSAMAACFVTERVGLPECAIAMSHAVIEITQSPRQKAAYWAIFEALKDVRSGATVHVPPELRAGTTGYVSPITKKYVHQDMMPSQGSNDDE